MCFPKVDHAHTLLLVLPGATDVSTYRLSDATKRLLKRITLTFGDGWWDFLMIGVSKWAYDQDSITCREMGFCPKEDDFAAKIDDIMRESFGLEQNLKYVFTDSWSQTGNNTEDKEQQKHWMEETNILLSITSTREKAFSFKTINKVLAENEEMRGQIKWLNDVITENITRLEKQITNNGIVIIQNSANNKD